MKKASLKPKNDQSRVKTLRYADTAPKSDPKYSNLSLYVSASGIGLIAIGMFCLVSTKIRLPVEITFFILTPAVFLTSISLGVYHFVRNSHVPGFDKTKITATFAIIFSSMALLVVFGMLAPSTTSSAPRPPVTTAPTPSSMPSK